VTATYGRMSLNCQSVLRNGKGRLMTRITRRNIVSAWVVSCALVAAIALAVGYFPSPGPVARAANANNGKPVRLSGALLGGGHFDIHHWHGKVVVIDFWGTWCPWCRKEAPYIAKLYKTYRKAGMRVIGIPVGSTPAQLEQYAKTHPDENWPQLYINGGQGNSAIANASGIQGFPTEVIVGRNGRVAKVVVGFAPKALAKVIKTQLKQKA
jgi:thiol-disulfide isomerase/thioredoxin